ncbi:MAG: polysaccharide biosynthesis protein, partial [Clostridia bacterium]|nr:polysaccharide biosynthesis protein [Clostridia bacterium]
YSMYKPIVEDDDATICALMNLYKKYYRIIGLVVLAAGLVLLPFVPSLIHGDVPGDINVRVLYLMYLGTTVLSYWLFAYKNSLLQAFQRVDVTNRIGLGFDTLKYALQLGVLFFIHNYYYYVLVLLVIQVLVNLFTAWRVDKLFPQYKAAGDLNGEEKQRVNQRVKDLFTAKVGAVVVNSADTIVISAFLGLTMLAIYQNYFYVLSAIIGIMVVFYQSVTAGIGNSLIVESSEKNYGDLKTLTFLIFWLSTFVTSSLVVLYQPFMLLWVGKDLMVGMSVVICFCIYFFVFEMHGVLLTYKDAGGIWHEDRWRPLATALTNLALNLLMVRHFGLYGIILSTVLATAVVGTPWLLRNLFTTLFPQKHLKSYVLLLMKYIAIAIMVTGANALVCSFSLGNPWADFFAKLGVSLVLPNLLLWLVMSHQKEYRSALSLGKRLLRRTERNLIHD